MDFQELYDYVKELKTDIKDVKSDIKDVKHDVRGVYEEVKKVNGRLRKAESDIIKLSIDSDYNERRVKDQIEEIIPSVNLVKHLNFISKKPKLSLFIFVSFIVVVQTIVLEAVANDWLHELFKFLSF